MEALWKEYSEIVIAIDKTIGDSQEYSHYQGFLYDLTALLFLNLFLWLVSVMVSKCWPVDFIWSNWPGIMAMCILYRSPLRQISPKQYLLLGVVWFWGLRLTMNFLSRWSGIHHEDWRYANMRLLFGARVFPLASLFTVFLGQSTFLFASCLSLYGALRNRFSQVSELDLTALTIMVVAVVLETSADETMDQFQKQADPEKLPTGLWRWSRHPNYFAEWLFWFGLWVFSGFDLVAAMGPVLLFFLLFFVSVPLMEERQEERRPVQFAKYRSQVPSSFFLLPPLLWWHREKKE